MLADRGEQFGQPPLVVSHDGVDPPGQAPEPPLVRARSACQDSSAPQPASISTRPSPVPNAYTGT